MSDVEAKDAFAPENLGPVILIQLMRLYDLQLAFLSAINPEKAQQILELHAQGLSFAPEPKFAIVAEDTDDDAIPMKKGY